MDKHALTFEKLNIDPGEWDVIYADSQSGYTFSTPVEGVLLLRTAGILTPVILEKQLQFINNYVIAVQKKIIDFKTIVILDIADLYNLSSIKLVRKGLQRINTDLIFLIPGSLYHKIYIKLYRFIKNKEVHAVFEHHADALDFAKRIKKKTGANPFNTGKFIELWSHNQLTALINRRKFKYIKLPEWQYENEQNNLMAEIKCFESGIFHFKVSGKMNANDIQILQQKVFDIGNTLNIDFVKNPFSIVFDLRNIKSITPDGRKLLRHMEEHQQKIAKAVIVLGNPFIRFLLQIRKAHQPVKYSHWHSSTNTSKAFKKIFEIEKSELKNEPKKEKDDKPSEDYNTLKNQYTETLKELKLLKKQEYQTVKHIRKILAYIHTGDFLRLPFNPRYNDSTIEGEIYNSIALLHKDLQEKKVTGEENGNIQLYLSQGNIEKILSSISDPAMIYKENKILIVNQNFSDLLGYQPHELNGQPLSAIVSAFEVNRIVRHLNEIHTHNEIHCDFQDALGIAHSVTLITEMILIDGLQAQLIFVRPLSQNTKPFSGAAKIKAPNGLIHTLQSEYTNKALAGVILFHYAMLKQVNNQVLNEYNAPSKHDSYKGLQSLLWVSFFLKNTFDEAASISFSPEDARMVFPGDIIKNLFTLFSDYLSLTKGHIKLDVREDHSKQKLALPLDDFFVKAILVRLMHLVTDNARGNHILFGYRQRDDEKIEFFIHENGEGINLVNTDIPSSSSMTGFSLAEIDQLLKKAGCNLFVEISENQKNQISVVFPVYSRGTGYEGAMMDLSHHKILILGPKEEFELISKMLEETGIKLISTQNIFESQKLLKKEKINLMMIDTKNRKIDTGELIKKAKEITPNIPIICLTDYLADTQNIKSILNGTEICLSRPLDAGLLKSSIKKALS